MNNNNLKFSHMISKRNTMLQKEKELYIAAVEKINMNTKELLNNDFGSTLVKNTAKDLAGEVARRFFDLGDTYITVDQLYERFVNFSYDNDVDLLSSDESIRKAYYNFDDSKMSETLQNISNTCQDAQKQLFEENRVTDQLDKKAKKDYRQSKTTKEGKLIDDLTGQEGTTTTIIQNGKSVQKSNLQADHIQARESTTFNTRYTRQDKIEQLKEFYNSEDNMQIIHASANSSKGDVRVCEVNGNVEYLNAKEMKSRQDNGEAVVDITFKATATQLTEAVIAQWEKESKSNNKIDTLKAKGYLDENGKVKPEVKKELERNIRNSQNKESMKILEVTDYGNVTKDAVHETKKTIGKIVAGQMIYYVLPPMIFEVQSILKKKDITLDNVFTELKKSGKRVLKYVVSKMREILKNIAGNTINKFIKVFFDIIIEMVKATVKKLMKVIKNLVLSLVNCVKIIFDKKATASQKMDSVTKILSATVTTVVVELLFEYIEKQFGLPSFLLEPLQIVVTVLSTNMIMLILQKMDLFDVQYGLLVSNIEKVFTEEFDKYKVESASLFNDNKKLMEEQMKEMKEQIIEIEKAISLIEIHEEDVTPIFEKLSQMFDMEIDFKYEWEQFVNISKNEEIEKCTL